MGSTELVQHWVRETMGWGDDRFSVHVVPHLSLPHHDLVMIEQKAVRSGGELYVMTDGQHVLPAGAANLGKVLAAEGLASDPGAVPAEQVAALFFRMAEVGRGRPLDDPAPRAARDGDGVMVEFSSERGFRGPVEHWSVWVTPDGSLRSAVETRS
jgi:hypothetical protein